MRRILFNMIYATHKIVRLNNVHVGDIIYTEVWSEVLLNSILHNVQYRVKLLDWNSKGN